MSESEVSVVDFGTDATSAPLRRREYDCARNLAARNVPYCRETESKAVSCYESRLNNRIERDIGKRYLRAGSISLHYVVNDDSKFIISNPRIVAETLPGDLHERVVSQLAEFLPLNAVNQASPENPFFHEFTQVPCSFVSRELFMSSAIGSFKYGQSFMLSILPLHACIQQLPGDLCKHVIQEIQSKLSTIFSAKNIDVWTCEQLNAFLVHHLLLVPQFAISLVTKSVPPDQKKSWKRVCSQINIWHIQFRLKDTPKNVLFCPDMPENSPANVEELE